MKAVVINPHLTDWYFKQCLDKFLHHWLDGVLDADWHWFRFEYQAKGSIRAHGCAKLKNDPNVPLLRTQAAQGWFYKEKASHEDIKFFYQGDIDHGQDAEKQIVRLAKNKLISILKSI